MTEIDKTLPIMCWLPAIMCWLPAIMCWLPAMHKTPTGAIFIAASKSCRTKLSSGTISKIFELTFNTAEIAHNKRFFYSGFQKFSVVQNSFPMVTKLNKTTVKKKTKSISTFNFSDLHTTIPHKLIKAALSETH